MGPNCDRQKLICPRRDFLEAETARLREALSNLLASVKVCPGCPPEAECYVFSMVALSEAGIALQSSSD